MSKNYDVEKRHRSWRTVGLGLATAIVVGLAAAALIVRHSYYQDLKPYSASQRSIIVTIPSGATVKAIGQQLQAQGLIKAEWAFEWYIRTQNVRNHLQAGTYVLRPNQGVPEIVTILTNGKIKTDLVTILPGQRLDQIKSSLVNNAGFSPADVAAALDPTTYADLPISADIPAGATLEGYLYPDSFQKTAETKPATIIRASLEEMQKQLTPGIRAAFAQENLSVYQGITLASIVEQEVSSNSDRATVAQVFLLRLKQNMPLGSDVTAFYGALKAGQTPSVSYDSPYNTRLYPGLPPGPISNVSASSLQAVAQPANTDYLYFVAGDDGITYFAHTEAEHEANVKAHCQKLCN